MHSELLKLTPFYLTQVLYWFILYIPSNQPGLLTLVVKCLPVSSLAFYIGFSGQTKNPMVHWLHIGMIFSVGGDACLVYNDLFILGMLSFACAHVCFIKAFGFDRLKPLIGFVILILMVGVLSLLLPNIDEIPIKIGFPLYSSLLGTMTWRALAKFDEGTVEKLTGIGATLFLISDGIIGVNMFYQKLPNPQFLIMSTYYLAQFLITLSAAKAIAKEKNQ